MYFAEHKFIYLFIFPSFGTLQGDKLWKASKRQALEENGCPKTSVGTRGLNPYRARCPWQFRSPPPAYTVPQQTVFPTGIIHHADILVVDSIVDFDGLDAPSGPRLKPLRDAKAPDKNGVRRAKCKEEHSAGCTCHAPSRNSQGSVDLGARPNKRHACRRENPSFCFVLESISWSNEVYWFGVLHRSTQLRLRDPSAVLAARPTFSVSHSPFFSFSLHSLHFLFTFLCIHSSALSAFPNFFSDFSRKEKVGDDKNFQVVLSWGRVLCGDGFDAQA